MSKNSKSSMKTIKKQTTKNFSPKAYVLKFLSDKIFEPYLHMKKESLIEKCSTCRDALMVLIFQQNIAFVLNYGKKFFDGNPNYETMWKEYFSIICNKVYSGSFQNMFRDECYERYLCSTLSHIANDVFDDIVGRKRRCEDGGKRVSKRIIVFEKEDEGNDYPVSSFENVCLTEADNSWEIKMLVDNILESFGEEKSAIFRMSVEGYKTDEIQDMLPEIRSNLGIANNTIPSEGAIRVQICRMKAKVHKVLQNEGYLAA